MADSDPTPGGSPGPYLWPNEPVHSPREWNVPAIAALVLSLLSLLLLIGLGILGLLVSLLFTPLALAFSIAAIIQVARGGQRGMGLAIIGFLLVLPGWPLTAFLLW
ncbi:hypothetical protein [Streptomyces collinus]|uniref:hypothetical protein n=1 Tax=Streptomyces collinus TaxID=42684 RepID=UPI003695C30A